MGVCPMGSHGCPTTIRVIVLNEIPQAPYDSLWHLFSGVPALIQFGAEHYQPHVDISSTIYRLIRRYHSVGVAMPYTMEELRREVWEEILDELVIADPDRLAERLSQQRLKGLNKKQIRKFLIELKEVGNGEPAC